MKTIQALRHPQRGPVIAARLITHGDVASQQIPMRHAAHIRRGHLIGGMRDIARIGRKSWDQSLADIHRLRERRIHSKANRFHTAVRSARAELTHAQKHRDSLETILDAARDTLKQIPLPSLLSPEEGTEPEAYEKESVPAICDRVMALLSARTAQERATIQRHAVRGTPRIWMRPGQIQQMVFNVINNALDSVRKTRKKDIRVDIGRKAGYVQLTISDTGCGIPPERLEKIFEPFHATKPAEEGMGLGLFMAQRIVEAHGGNMHVESKVGKGTTVQVLLPIGDRNS
jgi:signal transduction histidine kinase